MWIFTRYGFFSVVCARKGQGEHWQPVDPDRVMIRARRRSHLERLKDRFPTLLKDVPILSTASADYKYRILVPKLVWCIALLELAREMDYDNFKDAAEAFLGQEEKDYQNALDKVWVIMADLQT